MSDYYALVLAAILALGTVFLGRSRLPVLLHNAGWAVALFIVGSGLIDYTDISFRAWVFITALIAAFNLGALLPAIGRVLSGVDHAQDAPEPTMALEPLVTRRTFYALTTGYTVGFLYFLLSIAQTHGLDTFFGDPESVRAGGSYFAEALPLPVRALFFLGPLVFVMAVNPWLVAPVLRNLERGIVVVFVVLSLLTVLQRTNLFYGVLWAVGVAVVTPTATRMRTVLSGPNAGRLRRATRLAAMALVALLAFQVLAIVLNKTGEANPNIESTLAAPIRNEWGGLFIYSSGGVVAFGQLYESENREIPPAQVDGLPVYGDFNPQYWGRMTLAPMLKVVPVASAVEPISPFIDIPFPYNTYTWFEPYYRDFREPGAIAIVFLSGAVLAWLLARRRRGPHWLLVGALVMGCTLMAPFLNHLFTTTTLEMLVIVPLLAVWRPRSSSEDVPDATPLLAGRGVDAQRR